MEYDASLEKVHIDRIAYHWLLGYFAYDAKCESGIGKYGNIALEVESNPSKTGKAAAPWGTDENSKCDYIIIVDQNQCGADKPQMWICRMQDLRMYWKLHPDTPVKKRCAMIPLERMAEEYGYWHVDNDWHSSFIGTNQWELGEIGYDYEEESKAC